MMQESILPFWRQEILQEENTAFPPSSAFILEPSDDEDNNTIAAELDLSEALLSPSIESDSIWQQRYRSKLTFAAKVFALGIVMFAATALVVNIAVFVAGMVVGRKHQEDLSVTLTLSLEEATANQITSVDELAQIFNVEADETGVKLFRWPQNQSRGEGCLHCGENDDDDESTDVPEIDETQWVVQLDMLHGDASHGERDELQKLRSSLQGRKEMNILSPIGNVNSAFDDGEKILVYELEDFICEKIKEAFPGKVKETIGRICQLVGPQLDGTLTTNEELGGGTMNFLGSDRDQHGCISSAGYSWCEALNQCHRPWETVCESNDRDRNLDVVIEEPQFGNDPDDHGCDRSAGYLWCETSNSCRRKWETPCGKSHSDDKNSVDDAVLMRVFKVA